MIDFIVSIGEHSEDLGGRQPWKIRYPLSAILFLVFVSQLAGIETWKEMEDFIDMHEAILSSHVDLSQGCPSHDTLERVVSIVIPDFLNDLNIEFSQSEDSKKLKRLGQTHEENDDLRKQFFREVLHFLDENFDIISVR